MDTNDFQTQNRKLCVVHSIAHKFNTFIDMHDYFFERFYLSTNLPFVFNHLLLTYLLLVKLDLGYKKRIYVLKL